MPSASRLGAHFRVECDDATFAEDLEHTSSDTGRLLAQRERDKLTAETPPPDRLKRCDTEARDGTSLSRVPLCFPRAPTARASATRCCGDSAVASYRVSAGLSLAACVRRSSASRGGSRVVCQSQPPRAPCLPAASRVAHGGGPIAAPLHLNDVPVADRHDHVSDPLVHRTVKLRRVLGTERHDHARPVLDGLLDRASQAASEVAAHHVDDCLAAIAELPVLHAVPLCIGRQHFAQDLRATRDQGSPRPAHQLNLGTLAQSRDSRASTRAGGCGPLRSLFALPAVRLRSRYRRTAANTSEQAPARLSVFGDFARVRWPSRFSNQSGRRDSNSGPHRPERCALPGCATPRRTGSISHERGHHTAAMVAACRQPPQTC
jgi:hypothetical protein